MVHVGPDRKIVEPPPTVPTWRSPRLSTGLESWRLLYAQYYPQTLQSTITAEHLEHHPRPAAKVSDPPARLAEWDQNLRRCIEEGRAPPSDSIKRLALLKMLPPKERKELWSVAGKLYPTFTDVLLKVREIIADEADAKNNPHAMDVDNLEEVDSQDCW